MALTYEQALAWVERLYDSLAKRRPEVQQFDDYYRGKQRLVMASDIWREFHAERYRDYADNWCGVVTDAPAQRHRHTGVKLDDLDGDVSNAERQVWRDWQRNDMDRQSAQGIVETMKSRRSFVLVWADGGGEPVNTWEDPSQVIVAYDPEYPGRKREAALKVWESDDATTEYATLYAPDGLYKFSRTKSRLILPIGTGGWAPREVDNEPWPVPNPLGVVPVVEVPNRGPLNGEPLSEIGGVVPMQDAINLLWAYLFAAADHASMPARMVLGMEAPSLPKLDENGNDTGQRIPVDLKSFAMGRIGFLHQDGAEPKIDQWDAAKLDVFTDVIEVAVGHIAAQTRTPQHYLILGRNANPAAADALTAAEAGLTAKCVDQQLFMSSGVREVHRLNALVRGDRALADALATAEMVWDDVENRSEAQKADAATKWRTVGVPLRSLLGKYWSSDPQEIARVMEAVEAEREDPAFERALREFRAPEPVNAAPVD